MMRKKVIRIIAAITLLLLAACDYSPGGVADNQPQVEYTRTDGPDVREQLIAMGFSETELDAIIAGGISLERILNESRFMEYADKINNSRPIGPSGETILPEYYGGIYFNDEGILTVIVIDEAYSHAASAIAIAEMLELGIIVRSAAFTDRELNDAMNTLNQMAERVGGAGATSWGLDTIGNRVYVDLDPYTDEQKAMFLDLLLEVSINPDMITIRQAITQEMLDRRAAYITSATQSPGDRIVLAGDVEVSRTCIAFTLENLTDSDFNYGEPWDMACYLDEQWTPVPHLPGAGAGVWNDMGYSLQSGDVRQYRQEWERRFGELPPGRYMFIRDGWLGDWHQNQDAVYVLVEFFITEDSPLNLPTQND